MRAVTLNASAHDVGPYLHRTSHAAHVNADGTIYADDIDAADGGAADVDAAYSDALSEHADVPLPTADIHAEPAAAAAAIHDAVPCLPSAAAI